jgi:hypothetical protein
MTTMAKLITSRRDHTIDKWSTTDVTYSTFDTINAASLLASITVRRTPAMDGSSLPHTSDMSSMPTLERS